MQKDLERFLVRHNSKYGSTQVGYWMRSTFFDELPAKAVENIESFRNRADFVAEELSLIGEASLVDEHTYPQSENGSDIVELGSDMIEALEGSSVVVSQGVGTGDEFYDDVPTAAVEGLDEPGSNTPIVGLQVPSARERNSETPVPNQQHPARGHFDGGASTSSAQASKTMGAPWEKRRAFEYSPTEVGEAVVPNQVQSSSVPKGDRSNAHKKPTLSPQGQGSGVFARGRVRNEAVYVAVVLLLIFGAVLSVTMMWTSSSSSPSVDVSDKASEQQESSSFLGDLIDSIFGESNTEGLGVC